jgi:hypothetical protein
MVDVNASVCGRNYVKVSELMAGSRAATVGHGFNLILIVNIETLIIHFGI